LGAALQADGENEVRGYGLKHQKEKRSMHHFGGLDVSVKETSICIVDDTGRIVKEVKVASEPQALLKVQGNPSYRFKRIGLEAGPLLQCSRRGRVTSDLCRDAAYAGGAEGDCSSLRWVSSIRSFWLRSVFTCTGRYSPTRII
jgi:hypothetical protein